MSDKIFPTAQDAEAAFYDALERGDYAAMVAVWAEDEEILCVHPGGPRLRGSEEVLGQWKRILENGQRLRVRITQQVVISGPMIAVHSVQENISVEGQGAAQPVVATNVYQREAGSWRLTEHHASLPLVARDRGAGSSQLLH